jgi:hypothetical protein
VNKPVKFELKTKHTYFFYKKGMYSIVKICKSNIQRNHREKKHEEPTNKFKTFMNFLEFSNIINGLIWPHIKTKGIK